MHSVRLAAVAAASLLLAAPLPLAAQESPVVAGDLVDVGMIKVDDGHGLEYANYLASTWRKSQDYSKQQGWISGYEIWSNEYPREGEPDLYLITYMSQIPDAAEAKKRDQMYRDYMAQTVAQLEASSAGRAQYRHQMGGMLLRKQVWAKP
jgi:hypothetical protein